MKDNGKTRQQLMAEVAALRQDTAELLQSLAHSSPVGVYIVQDGKFQYVNPQFQKLTGFTQDELVGTHALNLVFPDDRNMVRENAIRMLKGERLTPYEYRSINKAGEVRWIMETVTSVTYQGRRAVLGNYADVTEHKQAEELLRVNRALRVFTECNHILVRTTDESSLLNEICRIIVRIGGYRMAWVGFAEHDKNKTVHPVAHAGYEADYLQTANITWADTERGHGPTGTAIRTGKTCSVADMLTDPRFTPWRAEAIKRGYASSIAIPLIANGRALGVLNIYAAQPHAFHDEEVKLLTQLADDLAYGILMLRTRVEHERAAKQLRESEAFTSSLLDNAPSPIIVVNSDTSIRYVNCELEKVTGFTAAEVIGRKPPYPWWPPETTEELSRTLAQEITQGVRATERLFQRKNGEPFWVEVTRTPIKDNNGQLKYTVGIWVDITEHKQAEKKARELAVLQEVDRLRRELLANISHELRTPLTAIKGFATTLLRPDARWSEEQQRDFLETINQETDRLTHLISDLLDMSRIEAGALKLEKGNHHLAHILKSIESRLSVLTQHHQLQVTVPTVLSGRMPPLFVDEMRIGQVITNLVDNAAKFSPAGSLITIGARLAGDQVIVSVTDQGIGIPPEAMDKLFDRFYQAESIATGRKSGTGLGLFITRSIITAHGGEIWVESQGGEGSTFYFSLPVAKGGDANAESTGHRK